MSLWQKLKRDDEKPVLASRAHWILLIEALIWVVFFGIAGAYVQYYYGGNNWDRAFYFILNPQLGIKDPPLFYAFMALGLYFAWKAVLVYLGTRVYLTNERLIFKVGVFFVVVNQVELEEIRATDVNQGPIAGLLNYGTVFVDCIFTEDFTMPKIKYPYKMTKTISKSQDLLTDMIPITPTNKAGIEKMNVRRAPQEPPKS